MRGSLLAMAEAMAKAAAAPRNRKAVVELTDAAAERIKALLEARHKVRAGEGRQQTHGIEAPPTPAMHHASSRGTT